MDIEANLKRYGDNHEPTLRYASFDYCYNYFQSHREEPSALVAPENLETSCLQLNLYLASWGMLRGSSPLLRRSSRHLVPLINVIAIDLKHLWGLDVDQYDAETIEGLCEAERLVREALSDTEAAKAALKELGLRSVVASNTLTTKILLGVFGCVPAFDFRFRRGLQVSTFGQKSLSRIKGFYDKNAQLLDSIDHPTIDFASGEPTSLMYPKAKLIDMVFYVEP